MWTHWFKKFHELLPRMSPAQIATLITLHIHGDEAYCITASVRALSAITRYSRKSIQLSLKSLQALNLLRQHLTLPGRTTTYLLYPFDHSKMISPKPPPWSKLAHSILLFFPYIRGNALKVLMHILHSSCESNPSNFPSPELAQALLLSPTTVRTAMNSLQAAGLISIAHPTKPNNRHFQVFPLMSRGAQDPQAGIHLARNLANIAVTLPNFRSTTCKPANPPPPDKSRVGNHVPKELIV